MINLNRGDTRSLHDQLVEQVRYLVAAGRMRPGEVLPSTRRLAEQLGISFHTVRKAYLSLAAQGVISSHSGSLYRVLEPADSPKSERLETGAAVIQETLRRLVSLGLDEEEISYLFEEQLELEETEAQEERLTFVEEFTEAADYQATECTRLLGRGVEAVTLLQAGTLAGVDYALTPFHLVRAVMEKLPHTDVIGVQVGLSPDACAAVARLFDHQTLLLVVRFADSIGPLSRRIRAITGFGGQVIATVVDEPDSRIGALVRQSDVFLYTPATARRVRTHFGSAPVHHAIHPVLSNAEMDRIRSLLPG